MNRSFQAGLSRPRQQLVRLMQSILFGRIDRLTVRGGDPVLDPRPPITREHKFSGDNGPHPSLRSAEFLLKDQHLDLFRQLDALGDGVVDVLEIRHGLPFRMTVTE